MSAYKKFYCTSKSGISIPFGSVRKVINFPLGRLAEGRGDEKSLHRFVKSEQRLKTGSDVRKTAIFKGF